MRRLKIVVFSMIALGIVGTVWWASRPASNGGDSPGDGTAASEKQISSAIAAAQKLDRDGRHHKAVEQYRRALASKPVAKQANAIRHMLIEALIKLGDADAVRTELDTLSRQTLSELDRVRILVHRSRVCRLEGKPKEALEVLNQALPKLRFAPEAVCERGILHLELGNLPAAVRDLETVVRANPNHEIAHFKLAAAYRRMKLPQDADRHYRAYERIHKQNLRAFDYRPYE